MAPPSRIGIVGLGLIGGSLAKGLARALPSVSLVGIDTHETTLHQAQSLVPFTAVSTAIGTHKDNNVLRDCDVIFLCVPIIALEQLLPTFLDVSQNAIITDVAGSKQIVETWAKPILNRFVGCHPMAGGTHGGFSASRNDLFNEMPVALCCPKGTSKEHLQTVSQLWSAVGARPIAVSAKKHDLWVAQTSHTPYVASLAHLELLRESPQAAALVGNGFRAATRHAVFAEDIMAAVTELNPSSARTVRRLAEKLIFLAELIERGDDSLSRRARDLRTDIESLGLAYRSRIPFEH